MGIASFFKVYLLQHQEKKPYESYPMDGPSGHPRERWRAMSRRAAAGPGGYRRARSWSASMFASGSQSRKKTFTVSLPVQIHYICLQLLQDVGKVCDLFFPLRCSRITTKLRPLQDFFFKSSKKLRITRGTSWFFQLAFFVSLVRF